MNFDKVIRKYEKCDIEIDHSKEGFECWHGKQNRLVQQKRLSRNKK